MIILETESCCPIEPATMWKISMMRENVIEFDEEDFSFNFRRFMGTKVSGS